jgi:TatD DNase family protein
MISLFDSHTHLDDEQFDSDRSAVIAACRQSGVETMLCVAISAVSSRAVVRIAEENQGVYAVVGIQPNYCAEAADGDWQQIVSLASHPKVVALGETGLDRYWDFTPLQTQKEFFLKHIELARETKLPLVIHCRDAEAELLEMLREATAGESPGRRPISGVLHAFSGDAAMAGECVELGLHISFAGMVTYKKSDALRQVAAIVPDDRILIETDSPYLVPHPLRGKQKRNEPRNVVHTARCLAEKRGTSVEEFAALTTANAKRLFFRRDG